MAYLVENGVTLCARCHKGVVHAEHTFNDYGNWKWFVPMFVDQTGFNLPIELTMPDGSMWRRR